MPTVQRLHSAALPPAGQGAAPRRAVTAYVSLFAPSGRRRWWWYSYRCATCSTYQLGRARQLEDVTGERRGGCGHRVAIVVARVYGREAT
jgi:hypothetical protein